VSYHTEVCCHNFLPLGFSPQSPLGNNGENRRLRAICLHRIGTGHRSVAQHAGKESPSDLLPPRMVGKHTTKRMKILCADGEKGHLQIRVGLFEEVFCRESPSIRLWLVVYRDIVVAGALCLHARKHVVNWHGATSRSTLHFGPSIFYFTSAEGCVRGRI